MVNSKSVSLACLDVGEKRIGVAIATSEIRIAIAYNTILVDGSEIDVIQKIVSDEKVDILVIGYPRNQSGEITAQTNFVENFTEKIKDIGPKIVFQDESLTSVMAEDQLIASRKSYVKADIDAKAAAIILQDYLELNYA